MKETRNNCFGSNIRCTALRQVKTGKQECRNTKPNTMARFYFIKNNLKKLRLKIQKLK